ncbi:MAG: alpha-mannosidase [Puniceicoccaceae bacterium]
MLPDTPFLQLVPARAKAAQQRMREEIWSPVQSLPVEWAGSSREHVSLREVKQRKRTRIKAPFRWGKMEDQTWFHIQIPPAIRDGHHFLEWKEQGESTAYIGGLPFAGLDVAHHECRIPKGCREIWMEVMALETGIWLTPPPARPAINDNGCRFSGATAKQRNDLAWEVCHDFEVLLDLLEDEYNRQPELRTPFGQAVGHASPLEAVSVLYRRLARHLENAVNAYDNGGLAAVQKSLKSTYASLRGQAEAIRCRLTGHSHMDLVWLWTEKASSFKAVHTFATINRLMEDYPELHFGYSQPASYRAVEKRSPPLMKAVRQRIQSGRWEPVGAADVEFDTLLPCGEALVRAILVGQEGFQDLQGKPSEILWLPDVFGYSDALPQILEQTGVKYFFTTKLHWNSISKFPYSSFIWQGPDGSEVLANVIEGSGFNMNVKPGEIRKGATEYRQADVHDEFLMPCGFGDGGGGVTPEMCERARRLQDLAGTPQSAWGRIDEFFAGLETVRKQLPSHRGELYLQFHRGILTTHGELKARFRAAERSLQTWEAAHCARGRGNIDTHAWKRMIFAQFHDYIPGSSIPEVYKEALPELKTLADKGLSATKKVLSRKGGKNCLFNPLPLSRNVIFRGKVRSLPPLCGKQLTDLAKLETPEVAATSSTLSNGRVAVRFDQQGRIRSMRVDGNAIPQKAAMGQLMLYPDHPHAFEAWEIDRSTLTAGSLVTGLSFVEAHCSESCGCLVFAGQLGQGSQVRIEYILEAASPVLKIEYTIDWREREQLLKVFFPTDFNGSRARFGSPFGSTPRSQQPGKVDDEAQWEVAGSRWAMVSDDSEQEGLFVISQAKYGWTARSGNLGLSLLRSARTPTTQRLESGQEDLSSKHFSDMGQQTMRIAIGRFDAPSPREELPAALAESLYTPPVSYVGHPCSCGLQGLEGGESLLPCWAKPEGNNNWTLRLHETLGRRGSALLRLEPGWSALRIGLCGNPVKPQPKGGRIKFKPYELLSLLISKD